MPAVLKLRVGTPVLPRLRKLFYLPDEGAFSVACFTLLWYNPSADI